MRIALLREGGLAGTRLSTSIDTGALPPDQRTELERLAMAFFDLEPSDEEAGPDEFRYTITVERPDGATRTLSFRDRSLPPSLRTLIARVRAVAPFSAR
jgi:hypothetical protein